MTRLDHILATVRERGGRMTTARRAVAEALVAAPHHVTADDLVDRVRVSHPEVHRSTIYRTLDAFESIGIVDHVHLGHGRAIYHLADEGHQHLVCEQCERVIEVPDDVVASVSSALARRYGFTMRARHFAVLGRCADCR